MKRIFVITALLLLCFTSGAQKWAVSVNALDCAALGTLNAEGSFAPARHWTVDAEVRYNPWTFREGSEDQFQNRLFSASLGTRWWPWHCYAGWWVSGAARYELYNRGGIFADTSEEGNAYGVGFSGGYALIVARNINIDFGVGLWTGRKDYTTYRCTNCGRIVDRGTSWFVMPYDLMVSVSFIF